MPSRSIGWDVVVSCAKRTETITAISKGSVTKRAMSLSHLRSWKACLSHALQRFANSHRHKNTQDNWGKGNRTRFGSNRSHSNNSICALHSPSFFTSVLLNPDKGNFLRPNWLKPANRWHTSFPKRVCFERRKSDMVSQNLHCISNCERFCCKFGTEDCCQFCSERVRELCHRFQLCKHGKCFCSDTDTLLMAAFVDGDELAFDDLYRRNFDWARKLAFKLLGNWQDACDVAQEAFMKVIASRKRWKPEAKFQTWFHRIVINTSLKRRNARMKFQSLSELDLGDDLTEEVEVLPSVESPEAILLEAERMEQLQSAIERLPERQRRALYLWAQGSSYRQIADRLGCSLSAVETLLHRAKQNLRKRFFKKM